MRFGLKVIYVTFIQTSDSTPMVLDPVVSPVQHNRHLCVHT